MFGDRVRKVRNILKLNQSQLSKAIGIDSSRLSRVENDKEKLTIEQLDKLSRLKNINLHWLLTGEGEMFLGSKDKNKMEERVTYHEMSDAEIRLLKEIIMLSEEACIDLEIRVDPKTKAEKIVKLFLHYHKEEIAVDKQTIGTILKLVS